MSQKFLANFLFLIFVNILVKPVYVFGIDMKVQDVVGPEEYGLYAIIFSFSFIFYIILDLGLTQYNSRIIAQDFSLLNSRLPHFIIAKGILGLVFFIAIFMVAIMLGYNSRELYWLGLLGVIHFLNSFTEYLRSNIAALHRFRLDAILSIINRGLLIIVCGVLIYGTYADQFNIEQFILIQIATLSFTALLSLGVVLKYAGKLTFSFDKSFVYAIFKESYPYALLVLLTTIYTRTDFVMLRELLPEKGNLEAGYYAVGYRFLDMAAMFGLLMAGQLLPMFARMIQEKKEAEISGLAQRGFKIIMFIAVPLSIGIACHAEDIIAMKYSADKYPPAYVGMILACLILSFIPIASSYVFNTLMNANASLRILNIIGILGVVANIIMNFILIPSQGALGAVYATIATQGLAALGHIYFANKILDLRLSWKLFARVAIFAVLMYVVFRYGWGNVSVNWIIQLILGGLTALPLGWILGLLDTAMLKELLNKKIAA